MTATEPHMTSSGAVGQARPPATPLDHLARALRNRASVPANEANPVAILWTDAKREWRRVSRRRGRASPNFSFGGEDPNMSVR